MSLQIGEKAPAFCLPSSTGNEVSLSSLSGKKVVLFFYPKDDTPGCVKEACGFRDSIDGFNEQDISLFGVSADGLESHDKFISKYSLNFPLLSDEEKVMSSTYGAWGEKVSYGKKSIGMKRMTFLINESGVLVKIWRNVSPEGHAEEVLQVISEL